MLFIQAGVNLCPTAYVQRCCLNSDVGYGAEVADPEIAWPYGKYWPYGQYWTVNIGRNNADFDRNEEGDLP